jgi:hypothetical protein
MGISPSSSGREGKSRPPPRRLSFCGRTWESFFSRRIGRLVGARAAAKEEYSVASQLNSVPLVSFRRQITRNEITAEGSR